MGESITLFLPRTKCENVRVLFSRIRLLFGVSVDPQEHEPLMGTHGGTADFAQFKLSEGSIDQLNKAKDYLLAACSDSSSRCERRCQYVPDIFQQLMPMRDEVERESSAMVRFEAPENQVVVSGQERNVLTAIRFLDTKAQDISLAKSRGKVPDFLGDLGLISQVGTQSREMFRQGRNLESEDSSYDSDYEIAEGVGTPQGDPPHHHDDVSRTVSDTLAAEFAEYVTQPPLADPHYTGRVEFALKLGYTESQVQIALQKLGAQPSQNELLAELIKLGASSSQPEQQAADEDAAAEDDPAGLRHIVIDGSNVAMSHGNKECFSCRGIKICVDWFRARGHQNITVFVPRWRKETSRPDAPIKDQEILAQLEKERQLVFTPSRHVGGRRLVCYDDRYVLRLAVDSDGIVVSNDNYRDLANESPEFKKIVEDRLLMYSFVNDRFMPPDDPLGRHGPSLDAFLRRSSCTSRLSDSLPPPCPYGKKCTYGNKCKYHHPERGNLPQKSVTERLAEQAKIPLQEVKSRGLKSRESSPGDKLKFPATPVPSSSKSKKQPLSRTKSLVPSSSSLPGELHVERSSNPVERTKSEGCPPKPPELPKMSSPCYTTPSGYGPQWSSGMPQISLTSESSGWATIPTTLPPSIAGAEMFLEPDGGGGHLFVAKRLSDPEAMKQQQQPQQQQGGENLHRKLQRQLTLNPAYDPRLVQLMPPRSNSQEQLLAMGGHLPLGRMASDVAWDEGLHQTVTRIASAPDSYHQWPPSSRMQHLNSTSDTRLNLSQMPQHFGHWLSQSHGLDPPARPMSSLASQPVRPSSVPPPGLHMPRPASPDFCDNARYRLYFHLASIFPKEQVQTVMELYPQEINPQKICAAILNMFPKG